MNHKAIFLWYLSTIFCPFTPTPPPGPPTPACKLSAKPGCRRTVEKGFASMVRASGQQDYYSKIADMLGNSGDVRRAACLSFHTHAHMLALYKASMCALYKALIRVPVNPLYAHTHVCVCVCVSLSLSLSVCVCVSVCMYTCVYLSMHCMHVSHGSSARGRGPVGHHPSLSVYMCVSTHI